MRTRGLAVLVALSLAFGALPVRLTAQEQVPQAPTANDARATMVIGTAWDSQTRPIPNARVRLRDLATGQVAAQATTNQQGEFTFSNVAEGMYVIELVDDGGRVVAVGETFAIAPGQTVITFVRLPPKRGGGAVIPFFGGVWGVATAAAIAAAVGFGISAVDECNCPPISCELPATDDRKDP